MALSRRKFTKKVKISAIQRLDAGASVAEVARAFEVNPNLLHRWRKEFRGAGMKPKSLNLSEKWVSKRSKSIF
jgi:transposase-like protein